MKAIVTLGFVVPVGYEQGDYAVLHSNNGSGNIDWDTPLSTYDLFPNSAGIFGFGHAPFGHFRFGHSHSMCTAGWGHLPFGHFPFGHGSAVITAKHMIYDCGEYKFAFACYDKLGNLHEGTPETATIYMHVAPDVPVGLKKHSYNKNTDILLLDAA